MQIYLVDWVNNINSVVDMCSRMLDRWLSFALDVGCALSDRISSLFCVYIS